MMWCVPWMQSISLLRRLAFAKTRKQSARRICRF
nr:MAG TPA: hypothetical protein [Caudoviricetes sp.]